MSNHQVDSDFDDTTVGDSKISKPARRTRSKPETEVTTQSVKNATSKKNRSANTAHLEHIAVVTHKAGMMAVIFREGLLIAIAACCGFFTLALVSFDPFDPGWSNTGTNHGVANAGGPVGAWLADVAYSLFGYMAYLFPLMLGYQAWCVLRERRLNTFDPVVFGLRFVGFWLVMVSATGMAVHSHGLDSTELPASVGGVLGLSIADAVDGAFGVIGGSLMLLSLLLFGLTIFIDISWLRVMDAIGRGVIKALRITAEHWQRFKVRRQARKAAKQALAADCAKEPVIQPQPVFSQKPLKDTEVTADVADKLAVRKTPTISLPPKPAPVSPRVEKEKQQTLFAAEPVVGELPPIGLLEPVQKNDKKGFSQESLEAMSRLLEVKLKDFNITVEVVEVLPGPVVTRFELQLAPGIKASRITGLAQDIARSLAVISVRVVEVIQGKSVIGIEIPNEAREMVRLSEVIASSVYEKSRSPRQ